MKRSLILVVREFDKFSSVLTENDFEVVNLPTIQTLPVEDFGELREKIRCLKNYDGLFFTSPKAAEIFLREFDNKKSDFPGKIYVLGNRTKTSFENTNFEIVFRDEANTAEEFINSFENGEFDGKRFLFFKSDKSLRTIPELLSETAIVDETTVYRTIENTIGKVLKDEIAERFSENEIGWICFFSPSGIESFVKTFGEFSLEKVKIAAIGATTAKSAAENNLKVEFISRKANAEDFVLELIDYIKDFE